MTNDTPKTRARVGKVWLGVGTAVLVSAGGMAAGTASAGDVSPRMAEAAPDPGIAAHTRVAVPSHTHDGMAMPAATATGQGGEGGESGGGGLSAEVKFLRDVGLIRGHLLVGDELVQQGHWDDGLPHYLHPVEEIYEAIRTPLKSRHVADFDGALKALAQTVKAKKPDAYKEAWARVDARLTELEVAEKSAAAKSWPSTTAATVIALLSSAVGEYGQAIEDGRIAKPVEYQDSRGFVFYGAKLLESVKPELAAIDADALAKVLALYAQVQTAWPAALPPTKAVMDQPALLAAISRVELAAGPLLAN